MHAVPLTHETRRDRDETETRARDRDAAGLTDSGAMSRFPSGRDKRLFGTRTGVSICCVPLIDFPFTLAPVPKLGRARARRSLLSPQGVLVMACQHGAQLLRDPNPATSSTTSGADNELTPIKADDALDDER